MSTLQHASFQVFLKRHPVTTYFVLTFIITWGGILLVVGPTALVSRNFQFLPMVFAYSFMLAGPSLAGILLTGLFYGRAGLRELLSRLLRWRVGALWYVVALLTAPLLMMAVLLALSPISPSSSPTLLQPMTRLSFWGMVSLRGFWSASSRSWAGQDSPYTPC